MPTLEFNGKHHIYTHHLTVPYRPLETDESSSCNIEVHANQNLLTKYGKPAQLSLFEPMYEYASDNELEKNFAHFL